MFNEEKSATKRRLNDILNLHDTNHIETTNVEQKEIDHGKFLQEIHQTQMSTLILIVGA